MSLNESVNDFLGEHDNYNPLWAYEKYQKQSEFAKVSKVASVVRFFEELYLPYAKKCGNNVENIHYHYENLYDIFERVEKRRVYFYIFHNIEMMNELHETALYCYWVLKFRPFYNLNDSSHLINESFAAFWFMRVMTYISLRDAKVTYKFYFDEEYVERLTYAFRYRDLSMESLIEIAEAFLRPKPYQSNDSQ